MMGLDVNGEGAILPIVAPGCRQARPERSRTGAGLEVAWSRIEVELQSVTSGKINPTSYFPAVLSAFIGPVATHAFP
jgi:hypothetical protein